MNLLQIQEAVNDLGAAAAETATQPTEFKLSILELEHERNCCIPCAEFNHGARLTAFVGANHLDWQWIEYIAIGVVPKWFAIVAYLDWVSILVQLEDAI